MYFLGRVIRPYRVHGQLCNELRYWKLVRPIARNISHGFMFSRRSEGGQLMRPLGPGEACLEVTLNSEELIRLGLIVIDDSDFPCLLLTT